MKILALETSSERCSAALLVGGDILERAQVARRAHAELILPMVESLLTEAGETLEQLDAIAFGRGPGSFTGVRVATAVTQGLAFGADRPVVPVSDLAALAACACRVHGAGRVLACLDARMHEIYWGAFEAVSEKEIHALGEEQLGPADSLSPPESGPWFGAGSGFRVYGEVLTERMATSLQGQDASLVPMARDIATLAAGLFAQGRTVSAGEALPVYLRDRVATPKAGV